MVMPFCVARKLQRSVVRQGSEIGSKDTNRFSYTAVTKDAFDYAARQMGWAPLKLLKLLDENRLLERQNSNDGYQMKVRLYTDKDGQRFDGDSEWCYCIKNIDAIGKTYVPEEHPLTAIDAKKLLG